MISSVILVFGGMYGFSFCNERYETVIIISCFSGFVNTICNKIRNKIRHACLLYRLSLMNQLLILCMYCGHGSCSCGRILSSDSQTGDGDLCALAGVPAEVPDVPRRPSLCREIQAFGLPDVQDL